ncbi:methyltransferase domain-containing protein [bacterium]|nr:methyltransferase domain-containing protein [bacterium]
MVTCPDVRKEVIRFHYDLSTFFYRLLWGEHIHHGLWVGDESAESAQLNLTNTMASLVDLQSDDRVLDVGCGMGGSSMHLARTIGCDVTGLTLSPFQARWAKVTATLRRLRSKTHFFCQDAETADFAPESFDVLWSIECTEHLFDKAAFFERAARWLKPGGRVVICAWLAGNVENNVTATQQVYDVCEGFFCPSLGTFDDYRGWMTAAGLTVAATHDWTSRVDRTWEICIRRVERTGVRRLAKILDRDTVMFLDRFQTLLDAYRSGAMQYGCFVAEKPE